MFETLKGLLTRVIMFGAAGIGITDTGLPTLVRATLPLGAALVLVMVEYVEAQTKQSTAALSVEAAKVAATQAAAAPRQAPPALNGDALQAAMAAAGAAIEAARAGNVATGQHAERTPTAVLPRIPADDDYPTAAMPVVPALPSPIGA